MSHHYIVTAQKPTAVVACVTGESHCPSILPVSIYNQPSLTLSPRRKLYRPQ